MSARAAQSVIELSDLEPVPFNLGYGVPLLVLSAPLAFAGAFLTLDRTRSFAPLAVGAGRSVPYRLEGGVGGLLAGWCFGVHATTMLALVLPNAAHVKPITVAEFVAVWVLVGVPLALAGGRWRLVALAFAGLTGGIGFALALGVLLHPPLLARVIIAAIFPPLLAGATLVPVPAVQRPAARAAAALAGAFGMIVAIAVLARARAWADVWDRLWLPHGEDWGSGVEHALTAAFWVIAAVGGASNWALHRRFGENPDQKWDAYLARYAASLPGRAGTFEPHTSWFARWFKGTPAEPIVFPDDAELHPKPFSSPLAKGKLKVPKKTRARAGGGPVKFEPLSSTGFSSDSDSDAELDKKPPLALARKSAGSSATSITAVSERARGKMKAAETDAVDYSDAEGLPVLAKNAPPRTGEGWRPAFLARAQSASPAAPGAVPVTPSLINALDRVQRAQKEAYGSAPTSPTGARDGAGEDPKDGDGPWRRFWAEVQTKAAEGEGRRDGR